MKLSDSSSDNSIHSSGWGYDYILSWISDATRMNRIEFENWRKITLCQKKDPQYINKYLKMLNSEENMRIKMEVLNKNKKDEFLNLLTDNEKQIIAEIVKGASFKTIPFNLGISQNTFATYMSGIYKKTKVLVNYGKRLKQTTLVEYLFNQCGFKLGDVVDVPKNDSKLKIVRPFQDDAVFQNENGIDETTIQKDKNISEQNAKIQENMLIDFGVDRILDSLKVSRDFLQGKYKKLCENLGDLLVQSSADKAQESPDYMLAHDYDDAIWGLTRAIIELENNENGNKV